MKQATDNKLARRLFGVSLAVFAIYFANVVVGGPLRRPPFLSDIQEMLTLFVSVSFFVFGTLAKEAKTDPRAAEES
jgi:hypothetical protein